MIDAGTMYAQDLAIAGTGDLISTNILQHAGPTNLLETEIVVVAPVAAAGGTSIQARLEGSPDASTWTTLEVGPVRLLADLTAGSLVAVFCVNPAISTVLPQYTRVVFARVGTFTAGTVSAFHVNEAQVQTKLARNYTV